MRRPINIMAAAIALLFAASSPALAEWVIARTSGTAWLIAPDSTAYAPAVGQIVPNTWMIATGPNGRVFLTRGGEMISVNPGSQMVLTEDGENTQIWQPVGIIDFDVEPRNVQHFSVATPLLAAVVKGTHFLVAVSNTRAQVHVERGAVEVRVATTGERSMVLTGQSVTLNSPTAHLVAMGVGAAPAPMTVGANELQAQAPAVTAWQPEVIAMNFLAQPPGTPPTPTAEGPPPAGSAPAGPPSSSSEPEESSGPIGPTNEDDCRDHGWEAWGLGFADEGDCKDYVEEHAIALAAGGGTPTHEDMCRHGVWEAFGFAGEGDCKDYVHDTNVAAAAAAGMPTDEDQCKNGGWMALGFADENACKDFVQAL